jgi:UDP-N-acetyl-D-glucosamine dehydrogenase
MSNILIEKIKSRKAIVGIVGLGYVGLPLAIRFAEEGFRVIGFDIDTTKVQKICQGKSYINHIKSENISKFIGKNLVATEEFYCIADVDVIILCVPTPLNKYREPDLSFLTDTFKQIEPFLREDQLLSLESTTYPGTTEEEIADKLTQFKIGKDFFLVYSPEREDPGNQDFSTRTIPKVVGGYSKQCLEIGALLYEQIIDNVVRVSSLKAAELTKLLENIHRAVNIGLVNEMKMVADKMGVNIHEVIDAAATKPFGFTPYYPGPGIGGHCIPIDPFYLTWKAREYGIHTRFIELAGEINKAMPEYVIAKLVDALNSRGKALRNSKILVLGIAYKKNIDDSRESPSVEIMEILRKKEAIISYSDPFLPHFPKMREHSFNLSSIEVTPANIKSYDAIMLSTTHDAFDYEMIKNNAQLLIDCRGYYHREELDNVVQA